MNLIFCAKTDVGRKRKLNEDSFCVAENIGLFLVADGMGGHAAGEVASQTAAEVVKNSLSEWLKKGPPNAEVFVRAIKLANRAVFEMSEKNIGMKGMGTTMTGILVCNGGFVAANVGDSRIYRFRSGIMEQLTEDHSIVGMQLSKGLITKEEAKRSSYRNVITRAIGTSNDVEVDTRDEEAVKGDVVLVCSDGLSSLVDDSEIFAVIKEHFHDLDRACGELINLANSHGGDDNITVILVKFL